MIKAVTNSNCTCCDKRRKNIASLSLSGHVGENCIFFKTNKLMYIYICRETSKFLKQYNQQRSVTTALSQLELDSMELHLRSEIQRQNNEASTRKQLCHATIQSVITDVERVITFT
jgi:hypothetical protein